MEQETGKKSLSREELRKAQKNKASQQEEITATQEEKPKKYKFRIRLIPIWLRLIILVIVMAVAVVAGAMFGYGVLGGGNPMDVLEKETWQHILDLVNKQ
ncbi:DNA-directed RNA polymerase subunit beta [Sutcliffiella horikoshii]|uniref:DNA-directed RNA polymerase subunit beta n=1 Tax=Sutcliffiella horikoshii TaxID=79883 RepID=A0A5D4T327_9BACI|nr:DNA-directed RNA polymerase subunit beta [Sutcliffiella horikoshii]TYS69689.1 DNA-directed RNA polymerase subunit beta [Sutcliffiella horikoshii]